MAKSLKKQRLFRESQTNSPSSMIETYDSSSDEEDSSQLDLKSCHSLETKTFVTEPTFQHRPRLPIGKQALQQKSVQGGNLYFFI